MNYSPLDRMDARDEYNDWLDDRYQEWIAMFGYPQPKAEVSYTEDTQTLDDTKVSEDYEMPL